MPVTFTNVHDVFTTRALDPNDVLRSAKVRIAAEQLVIVILQEVPNGADQQAAIRNARLAWLMAHDGIVTEGLV